MKRLSIAAVFSLAACAAGFAKSGSFSGMAPSLAGINASAPRYTTEDERLISEIAGSILNIAAFADHFEPSDAFQVRTVGARKFSIARRAEMFTVQLPGSVWSPAGYERLARSFMADGAGLTISEDPTMDRAAAAAILEGGPDAVRLQNARLSRLLGDHPRSAALHERAALLLAVDARRRPAGSRGQVLCRMTAHLAVARALHPSARSVDGELAEQMLSALAKAEPNAATAPSLAGWAAGPATFGDTPQIEIVPAAAVR